MTGRNPKPAVRGMAAFIGPQASNHGLPMNPTDSGPPAGSLVIGVGNPYRRDDGVGLVVARRLAGTQLEGLRVLELRGEGTALMEAWRGGQRVIVVDAVQSGAPPGRIHRLDARAQPMPSGLFHCSSHAVGLAEAIELARALGQLPLRLVVYGVEGQTFAAGEGLSPAVAAAAEEVVKRVLQELR